MVDLKMNVLLVLESNQYNSFRAKFIKRKKTSSISPGPKYRISKKKQV